MFVLNHNKILSYVHLHKNYKNFGVAFRNKKDLNKLDEEVDVYKNTTSSFLLSK